LARVRAALHQRQFLNAGSAAGIRDLLAVA